jgi:hypothetical protein
MIKEVRGLGGVWIDDEVLLELERNTIDVQ